jgi:hypothetical protein
MTDMPESSKEEVLAFIDAMRLTLEGKVGFKWVVDKLSGLSAYIESLSADNERMNAYLDAAGLRDDFDAFKHGQKPAASDGGRR